MSGCSRSIYPTFSHVWKAPGEIFHCCPESVSWKDSCQAVSCHAFTSCISIFWNSLFWGFIFTQRKVAKGRIWFYHLSSPVEKQAWIPVLVSDITTESKHTAYKMHWFINRIKLKCSDMFFHCSSHRDNHCPIYRLSGVIRQLIHKLRPNTSGQVFQEPFPHFPGTKRLIVTAVPMLCSCNQSMGDFPMFSFNSWGFLHLE